MSRRWLFWLKPDTAVVKYAQEVLDSGWVPPLPGLPAEAATHPPAPAAASAPTPAGSEAEAPDLLKRFYLNQGC